MKYGLENIKGEYLSENEITNIFDNLDQDLSGYIDYEEFLRATLDYNLILSEQTLLAAFNNFDKNKDGKLDREELKAILSADNNEYFDDLIKKIDKNNDGEIDFIEFSNVMNGFMHDLLSHHETLKSLVADHIKPEDIDSKFKPRKKSFFTVKNMVALKRLYNSSAPDHNTVKGGNIKMKFCDSYKESKDKLQRKSKTEIFNNNSYEK